MSGLHPEIVKHSNLAGKVSITEIKRDCGLGHSVSTIYNDFKYCDVPVEVKRLISYLCIECSEVFIVILVFYGFPKKPPCPYCDNPLKYNSSKKLPFYYPNPDDFYMSKGLIKSVQSEDFQKRVLPLLAIPLKSTPLFVKQINSGDPQYHIIKLFNSDIPQSFCRKDFDQFRYRKICSGLTEGIPVERVCRKCMIEAIKVYDRTLNLSPKYRHPRLTTRQRRLKLFKDAKRMNNVRRACRLNGVSYPTYYSARRKYRDLYQEVIK